MTTRATCHARGCAAVVTRDEGTWCRRHHKLLTQADSELSDKVDFAIRGSPEWCRLVRMAQDAILGEDKDAARQREMFR